MSFILFILFGSRERERKTYSIHLFIPRMPTESKDWTKLKPGVWDSIQASHVRHRDPGLEPSPAAPQEARWQEALVQSGAGTTAPRQGRTADEHLQVPVRACSRVGPLLLLSSVAHVQRAQAHWETPSPRWPVLPVPGPLPWPEVLAPAGPPSSLPSDEGPSHFIMVSNRKMQNYPFVNLAITSFSFSVGVGMGGHV